MAEIILFSVALINQKCIYSTLDVINAFPSIGNHLAFNDNYSFTFMERAIQCNDPAEGLHTRCRDFICHISLNRTANLGPNYSAIAKRLSVYALIVICIK